MRLDAKSCIAYTVQRHSDPNQRISWAFAYPVFFLLQSSFFHQRDKKSMWFSEFEFAPSFDFGPMDTKSNRSILVTIPLTTLRVITRDDDGDDDCNEGTLPSSLTPDSFLPPTKHRCSVTISGEKRSNAQTTCGQPQSPSLDCRLEVLFRQLSWIAPMIIGVDGCDTADQQRFSDSQEPETHYRIIVAHERWTRTRSATLFGVKVRLPPIWNHMESIVQH